MTTVSLTVNGKPAAADVESRTLLVQMLREKLGLTGTHVGCDTSQCGACVVHVNGQSVKSCTILAVQAEGANVTTIEGLATDGKLHPMQEAFRENHGAAMRLLHAGHDDERARPREAQPQSRASARCASGSRAISAAAPAITTSSSRSRPAPQRCAAAAPQPSEVSHGTTR